MIIIHYICSKRFDGYYSSTHTSTKWRRIDIDALHKNSMTLSAAYIETMKIETYKEKRWLCVAAAP